MVDRELRDWLRSLTIQARPGEQSGPPELSAEAADYLAEVARDGTLKQVLEEYGRTDRELAG